MAILSERFPDKISVGAEGGWPGWLVSIVEHAGGQETPNLDDPHPKGRWNVARVVEASSSHALAKRHFIKARGPFHRFRFKDWGDYICPRTGEDRGELIGSGTTWQMTKTYGADDATYKYARTLHRVVANTTSIWRNNTLQSSGSDYTLNVDTGVVTSASSWTGSTLEMQCEFDVLCRYDIDSLNATLVSIGPNREFLVNWRDIDIVEVREEEA